MDRAVARVLAGLVVAIAPLALTACAPKTIRTVRAFEDARLAADHEGAQAYLGERPRVWYGSREGDGEPYELGLGRWRAWDEHFDSQNHSGTWRAEGSRVWHDVEQWSDYDALIERAGPARYRKTYFLDDDGKIEGVLISGPNPRVEPGASRFDEIEAWARTNHPGEWAYLRPGGRLDPTGDRAPRTRALINRWRESVGLGPID